MWGGENTSKEANLIFFWPGHPRTPFLDYPEFCKSTAYMDFLQPKKGVRRSKNYRANYDVGVDVLKCRGGGGVKIRRNRPTCFYWRGEARNPPHRPFSTPICLEKKVPTLHSTGLEKAQRRSKNKSLFCPSNAFYRFSFTRSAVREFHFEVTDTATMVSQYREREKKPTFFMLQKSRFLGHPRFFQAHGLYGLLQPRRGYVRARTLERNVTRELIYENMGGYVEIGQVDFFWPGHPRTPFLDYPEFLQVHGLYGLFAAKKGSTSEQELQSEL